jgi:hypothetical protein
MQKIINLSFQRNATQSISEMLFNFGIPGIHHITGRNHSSNYAGMSLTEITQNVQIYEDEFVHFADAPYFMMYEYFDRKYPNSKFLLVKREPKQWLKSFKKLYTRLPIDPVSRACIETYLPKIKSLSNDEIKKISDQDLLFMYNFHNNKIEKYFFKTDKLLTLDIDELDDVKKISSFLNIDLVYNSYNIDFLREGLG